MAKEVENPHPQFLPGPALHRRAPGTPTAPVSWSVLHIHSGTEFGPSDLANRGPAQGSPAHTPAGMASHPQPGGEGGEGPKLSLAGCLAGDPALPDVLTELAAGQTLRPEPNRRQGQENGRINALEKLQRDSLRSPRTSRSSQLPQ